MRGGITGGDNVVNNYIKKIVEENGVRFEFVNFDKSKYTKKNFFYWLFGDVWFINRELKQKLKFASNPLVVCDSQLAVCNFGCKTILISHYSFLGYYLLAQRKTFSSFIKMSYNSILQRYGSINNECIAVSDFQKRYLIQEGNKVSRVITNPMSVLQNKEISRNHDFIFLGRYDHYGKGFDVLEKLAETGWNIDCYTNGSNPCTRLNYKSPISHDQVINVISQYKILLHPSRFETCGMTVLEALSCGTPVIMSCVGIGDHLQYIIPEFVVSKDTDIISEYQIKYATIIQNYDFYSDQAKKYVERFHSIDSFKANWKEVLCL